MSILWTAPFRPDPSPTSVPTSAIALVAAWCALGIVISAPRSDSGSWNLPENLMKEIRRLLRFTCVRRRNAKRSEGPMSGDKVVKGLWPISV